MKDKYRLYVDKYDIPIYKLMYTYYIYVIFSHIMVHDTLAILLYHVYIQNYNINTVSSIDYDDAYVSCLFTLHSSYSSHLLNKQ